EYPDLSQPSRPAGSESPSYDRPDPAGEQIVPPPRDPFDPPYYRALRAYEQLEVPPVPATRRRPERRWKYAVLLLLTFATTTLAGAQFYAGFYLDFGNRPLDLTPAEFYLNGFWYSLSILAILGAHELGHYFACRYYGVDASLPYFLPVPPPLLTGTLGAFIRIRQPIPSKRQLFDIGIA